MKTLQSNIAFYLFLLSSSTYHNTAYSFSIYQAPSTTTSNVFIPDSPTRIFTILKASPSTVVDEDGLTPSPPAMKLEQLEAEDVPELHYDPDDHPIPHQPWRRGDTDGCEDPIEAPWRLEGEEIIRRAVVSTGAAVNDITWFMATVVVTLDHDSLSNAVGEKGPEIRVENIEPVLWCDPDEPKPEDDYGWYEGEEDGRVVVDGKEEPVPGDPYVEDPEYASDEQRELTPKEAVPRPTREAAVRNMRLEEIDEFVSNGMKVTLKDRNERLEKKVWTIELYNAFLNYISDKWNMSTKEADRTGLMQILRRYRLHSDELALHYPEEFARVGPEEPLESKTALPMMERYDLVDTDALSIISKAILDALEDEDVEARLRILSRHELILASPGEENFYVETQQQFENNRGKKVLVQTQDPFGSNRVLEGHLVDRNALDVVINVEGRLVTIPMNFVDYVELAKRP